MRRLLQHLANNLVISIMLIATFATIICATILATRLISASPTIPVYPGATNISGQDEVLDSSSADSNLYLSYTTKDEPSLVLNYYELAMRNKGWLDNEYVWAYLYSDTDSRTFREQKLGLNMVVLALPRRDENGTTITVQVSKQPILTFSGPDM